MCWNSHHQTLTHFYILLLSVTPQPTSITHFVSLSLPSFHLSARIHICIQNTVSTSLHSKLQTAQTCCVFAYEEQTSYGNVIVPGQGHLVARWLEAVFSSTPLQKVLCSSASFYSTTRLVQRRHAGRINPSLPAAA